MFAVTANRRDANYWPDGSSATAVSEDLWGSTPIVIEMGQPFTTTTVTIAVVDTLT